MQRSAVEMELPLDDGSASELARRRVEHLAHVSGVDRAALVRLARAYPSLAAIYSATEEQLSRIVGEASASRIRWFLDAPLSTAVVDPARPPVIARAA
jgi:ERCC4-type nuclease